MSGICGVFHWDGRDAQRGEIDAILTRLERRGPDGSRIVTNGAVGLGQASLATTPEAVRETLPLRHAGTGCIITADARLDHPDELAAMLGAAGTSDGELILLAYLKWGANCLDHLRGDFAFAIWDPRDQVLFCARDQVGMRQLIWHHQPGKMFAFATETQALVRHQLVPCEIDQGRTGDFVEDLEAHDLTSTFFVGVNKLPPAHAMMVRRDGVAQWQYWRSETQEPLILTSDQDYADAFLDVFSKAVKTRLRSAGPVGSTLSGGMDSSSVSAVAAKLLHEQGRAPLKTFSALRNDTACVESNAIRSAMSMPHLDPTAIALDEIEQSGGELSRLANEVEEPFDIFMALPRAVYLAAQRADVKVMLDGVGGDTTLGSEPMVAWYLQKWRLIAALREARGEKRFWGSDAEPWAEHPRSLVRAIAPSGWVAKRQARYREQQLNAAAERSLLDPAFSTKINMPERRRENTRNILAPDDEAARRIHRIFHPHVVVARERYDRTAALCGIEPRDPFLDLRLIEFCLSLPQSQLQRDGWPKTILRRAMAGLVPDEVRWRAGKEHLGYDFMMALTNAKSSRKPKTWRNLRGIVSGDHLNSSQMEPHSSNRIEDVIKLRYLEIWLEHVSACN